jgi:hypothetical protein
MTSRSRLVRALPAVLIGGLFLVALNGSVRPVQPTPPIASGWKGPCVVYPTSGFEWADVRYPNSIVQPVAYVGNAAACSLTVEAIYGSGRLRVVQVDPETLLPDPTTIALRTLSFDASTLLYGLTRRGIYPSVVVRHLDHVAEPPGQALALQYIPASGTHRIAFDPDGSVSAPVAYRLDGVGVPSSLPGSRPVLRHIICGGDSSEQALSVAQSVVTTNTLCADTSSFEVMQRFRVPAPVVLTRLEIAPGGTYVPPRPTYAAILPAAGPLPPVQIEETDFLAKAFLPPYFETFWMSAYSFDRVVMLEPSREYWLLVHHNHSYALHGRIRNAIESDDFNAGIGAFFKRSNESVGWTADANVSLSFKLIGDAITPLKAITGVAPSPGALRLRVMPNPAKGNLTVSWSGAQGVVHLSLVDATGRRVSGTDVSAASGRWQLGSARSALPAGVYFARATDARGGAADQRVVVLP